MALLGTSAHNSYQVSLVDNFGNVFYEYILATDVQDAAQRALELSNHTDYVLKDVRLWDEE